MGLFDFLKPKTPEQKLSLKILKLREKYKIKEKKSVMHSFIITNPHDNSLMDENPQGKGEFGLTKTNPIPVYGIDNIPAYIDKLRYVHDSNLSSESKLYYPVTHLRTSESDNSDIGSLKPQKDIVSSATSSPNISGAIDVYNLYSSVTNKKLAKIYINVYSLKVSNKVPKGFFHRDNIPPMEDGYILSLNK